MRLIGSAVTLLSALAFAQEKQETVKVIEEKGVAMYKPKDEAWELRTDGGKIYKETCVLVSHRVESFTIEVLVATKQDNQTWKPMKEVADEVASGFEKDNEGKAIEGRKVRKRNSTEKVFPGAGAPKGWFLDLEIDDRGNKTPIRMYLFVDKQNPNHQLRVSITGSDELYKKFEKDVNMVLASLKTFKVKKK
jgi:hypothetical protein